METKSWKYLASCKEAAQCSGYLSHDQSLDVVTMAFLIRRQMDIRNKIKRN